MEKLEEIVNWLNDNFNQDSERYSIFFGAKPGIIRYDEHTAISPWACGAIVCIDGILYFIEEDDGNWWVNKEEPRGPVGYQTGFSIGWARSFASALLELEKYVIEHGTPVYFSGTDVVCYYQL